MSSQHIAIRRHFPRAGFLVLAGQAQPVAALGFRVPCNIACPAPKL
jgi:hypothetical protein